MNERARLTRAAPTLLAALCALCALLAGCAVGPDWSPPRAPAEAAYTPRPIALQPAGEVGPAQRLLPRAALPAHWWEAFASPELDATVARALADSPTLQQARATLQQAREAVLVARGGMLPQLDLQAGAARARAATDAPAAELYSAGPLVAYAPDVFGGTRRLVEQQQALVEVQREQLEAARLALSGQTVAQAIAAASAREQLREVQLIVEDDRHNLELVRLARSAGQASGADVATAQSQLAADLTLLAPLRQQLAVAQDALALLIGRGAGAWQAPEFELQRLRLPAELPLVVPSELVRARPDIRAAEAQLHAASAAIGVASADLYPRLTLSAGWSAESATLGALFSGGQAWALSGALAAPLWHGGALRAQRRAAQQAYDAQLAVYRQTVLLAFRQVADVLQALQHDAQLLQAQRDALASADESLRLAREAYAGGAGSVLQVLAAQRADARARLGEAQARAQRLADTAQWYTAMGAVPAP